MSVSLSDPISDLSQSWSEATSPNDDSSNYASAESPGDTRQAYSDTEPPSDGTPGNVSIYSNLRFLKISQFTSSWSNITRLLKLIPRTNPYCIMCQASQILPSTRHLTS